MSTIADGSLRKLRDLEQMMRAVASYKVRDELHITEMQATARADVVGHEVGRALIRGAAAEEVCRSWNRDAELQMVYERLLAEHQVREPPPVMKQPAIPGRPLPALTRGLRRKLERKAKKAKS